MVKPMKLVTLWIIITSASVFVSVAWAQSRAVTVTKLADDAYCRDKTGSIIMPRTKPKVPFLGNDNGALGMVATADGICYFYNREVILSATDPFPSAAQGQNANEQTFGTRGLR
jgi:hypothetical protein